MKIGGCHACETCIKTGKACSFDDDFNRIAPVILESDAVVFTMPVYWYSIPAQIKGVIDRLFSLVVGGIGVMNIMLVSVTERTQEIGVRMAVGARQSDILQQFLIEAVLVCILGGILGVLLSLGIGQIISHFAGDTFQMAYSTTSIAAAFACSSMIGIVFGFIPARNAARLNPVDALSRE